jgi:hypothetical protein
MSISFAATPQSKEAQQARTYTDPSAGAPPSRRSGYNAPYVDLGHWNKVFTDQNYFDSIAKQKGMTEGAKVSLHGDDYVYRQAMIGYLADTRKVPLDDMRSIFDAEKDGFAKTVLGKQTASAREMFDWQKGQFERSNEKQAAARMIEESVMRRSLEDAFSGGDTPFVESVAKDIEAAGDLFDEEEKSRLWEKAEQLDKQIRASQAQFAPEARYIFNALRQYSGESAGFGAPEMADLAGRLAKLPTNQRRAIMQLAGSFGQLQQIDKGFWYQMAESIGRGTTDFSERIPRNTKEQTLRGNLRLLKSEQPVFKGVGLDGAVAYSAAGETPITPEEREQAIQDAEQQVGVLMVQRELRELAETQIDPIKTVTMLPSWVEEGLYGAARSVPYTAAAAVPVAGVFGVAAALYSKFYDQMMVEYPDADPNDVALVAAIGAPVAAGLERLKLNTIMGRLPIFGRLVERLVHPNQKNVYRIMWRGGGMIAEQNVQEFAQERVYPLGQSIASALGADIPSYDWEKWYQNLDRELLVQFVALLPLSLLGAGVIRHQEIKRGDAYLKDKPTLMKVLSEAATDRVLGAATTEEAQAIFREEYAKRTPEEAKAAAQRVVDEVVAVRQQQQSPDMPKLERRGAEYVVVSPDGQTLAASTDQTTAEQALLSASREVVEKELMVERQRFADTKQEAQTLKEWWLAEDPKRQANERRVIREGENQITAQQKLEMLEKAGNKQGIEELHRRIAQSPYAGTPYDKIFILGEASVEQVGEMVFQSVIALNPNSDVRAAREEMHHTAVRVAVANGRADESMLRGWLEQSERVFAEKGVDIALPRADMTDIVESMAVVQEAFENERISADVEMSLPQEFVAYIKRMIQVFVEVLKRGKALREAFDAGALPSEFEAFLAETTGVADQTVVDRSREKTAQEVAPETANYSIGLQSFKDWFGDWENDPANASKVVDENGRPKVVYHGTQRPDRIGSRFRKSRATSGPMAFFTANPEIGSSYAKGKSDTSLELPNDYAGWFKYKGKGMRSAVDIDRAWWSLSEAERETIRQRIYTVGYENADEATGPIVSNSSSIMGRDSIDYELRQARGNALRALVETWLTSGSLFNREEEFMQVLEAAGMDMGRVTYDSPFAVRSAVYPVYLSIKNPLNTSNIPADVFAALEQAGKRKRAKRSAGGNADAWDKNTISGKDWLEALRYDMETGSTMAWTRIPDWATETLAMLGYDGIHDLGGKYGGEKHDVWIPFVETQVKSATGNRGTFDPTNPNINYSIASGGEMRDDRGMALLDDAEYLQRVAEGDLEGAKRILGSVLGYSGIPVVYLADINNPSGGWKMFPATFVRFGLPPTDAPSGIFSGAERIGQEAGVSVYAAWKDPKTGKYVIRSGGVSEADSGGRKAYEVVGQQLDDLGSDEEALLQTGNVRVIREIPLSDITDDNDPRIGYDGSDFEESETPYWENAPDLLDPVVLYDAQGNIVPPSVRFPPANYSISTQREIDRVQAAMDRLARSPSERISQYAALKERLAAALERNKPIMQSMRGDMLPQDFDRTRILNDLGFLDYILKVLPPEVRGRVGGYTNLASIAPVDVYKGDQKVSEAKNPAGAIISAWMREGQNIGQAQKNTALPEGYSTVPNTTDERRDKTIANFLIDRLKKIDRELERYYKRDLMERIFDALDKSRPKAGQSGVKRSTLGAETQKFADMVYRSSLLDDEKTAERLAAIEAQITSTEATADSQKRISELSEEWTIVNTFGDLKSRPSETLAYGLEWLQTQLKAGREAWQIKEAARIQENRERAAKVISFLGKPTDFGRFENKSALQRFLQAVNAFDLDHKSFEQFAPYLFGDEVAAELSKKMQRAQIDEAKLELENTRSILAALRQGAKAAGVSTSKALVAFKENQPYAVRKMEGRKVKDTKISIELAKKIVRGLADRGSLSNQDVQTLSDELAALPRDTKKEFVTIKQVIFRGEEVRLTMSRAQAMQLWLTWQQSDAQEKMRADGFTDDSFDDLDNLISGPFAQAILRVTSRIYGSGYALTNPIYARMFGMNMPMVRNYAPARYLSSKEVKDVGLDGSPLTAGGQPSFAKSRVNHTAKLAPEDALTVLQSHIAMQSHWVAFAEVTREYRSLLSNPDVRESIRQRLGADVLRTAEMWGDQMEQRGGNKGREIAWINNMLGAVIGGQSVSLLGYNLKSLMMQTDNLMRFTLALDSRQIGSALSDPVALMQNVRKVWKTDIIQTRLEGGATAETRFFFERFVSMFRRGAKVAEMSMMPMNYLDSAGLSISGAIVYQAAYKDALDSGIDPTSAERAAKDAVEAMVYRYGQPVLMGQKSNIENSGNAFTKAFFLFMSDPRLKMAIISDSVRGLATGRGDWKTHVRRIVAIEMMAVVSHVLATAFRDATSDDEDEDLWSMGGFARALLLAPFQGYFLLGSVSDLVLSRLTEAQWFTPTQNPLIRTADTAFRAFNNLDDAFNFDDPDALVKEWTNITRSIAVTPPLAAPAVIMNLVRPLVQGWEHMLPDIMDKMDGGWKDRRVEQEDE